MQNTLDYSCLCQNGSAPGLQYYLQSMPTVRSPSTLFMRCSLLMFSSLLFFFSRLLSLFIPVFAL